MAAAPSLERLLRPRSVAVLGAKSGRETIRQLRKLGYAGEIWPVHPREAEIEGLAAFASIDALPAAPDAAFVGVNRNATIEVVEALARRGAGGAVLYAAGFAEVGAEGRALQQRLVDAAGAMPILGPNCYGFINYLDRVSLWPDQHGAVPVGRGAAIVTQSGNIALNLTMGRRALPLAYIVTLGNQATLGIPDLVEGLAADDRVTAIGLHIEGIADRDAFARAAAFARARGKPLVALKTGASEAGAQLTVSHTASLAGADAAVDAFLAAIGVARVHSVPVLLEALKLLHLRGPLAGRRIASMSCSGGEAALIADTVARTRLEFPPIPPANAARLQASLGELVTISNPLDYHTFAWANETALDETFTAMLEARFDMTLLVLDFPRGDRCSDADWLVSARALATAARRTGAGAGIVATLPEAMPEAHAEAIAADGLVPFLGVEEALAAIEAAASIGAELAAPSLLPVRLSAGRERDLSEAEGKALLASHGIAVPEGALAATPDAAVAAAERIGFPVVAKAVAPGLQHKTEAGGVRLRLADAAAVRTAAIELLRLGDRVLVEGMVTDGVAELILGLARDPAIGPYLVIGSGGILAELVGDRRILLPMAAREAVAAAIAGLKAGALIAGHRGRPEGDLDAAVDAAMALQRLAAAEGPLLAELDVNPLIVRPRGRGAVAVDALVRLREEEKR